MIAVYVSAPFAAFRNFTAGWYRPTATFLTPSAAYGLVLNLAGVDSRLREEDDAHPGKVPATLMRADLPNCHIAIGAATFRLHGRQRYEFAPEEVFPIVQSLYQQLHNYPVGTSGRDRATSTFGNKYNITPVRRELLVGLHAIVAVNGNRELESQIREGLEQGDLSGRYGLPFLGDNAFLIDRCEEIVDPLSAFWYERVTADETHVRNRNSRMTIRIDRANMSESISDVFAPALNAADSIPPSAWVHMKNNEELAP